MKAALSLTFVALAIGMATHAYDIRGLVTDPDGEPLGPATVRLLAARDSSFVAGTSSDAKDGRFTLRDVPSGRYIVEGTFIGLSPAYADVKVSSASVTLERPLQLAQAEGVRLDEVTVRGVRTAMKATTDTVEFNAGTYLTRPNAVVEDLLKRLPGVEVSSDGKITANGKEVSKILVDGEEFFGDDPKAATKNLPADMVDKLQVIDRKSTLARLTGVDDGEDETVINLSVKPGMRNGWFGSAEGGYGTDKRYMGSLNVSRFQNGSQFTLLGNVNNINDPGFTPGGGNARFRRFGAGQEGVATAQSLGLNFNTGPMEGMRIGGDVMYGHDDTEIRKATERTYLFPDSTSYQSTRLSSRNNNHTARADFRMKWDIDSFNLLELRPNLTLNFGRGTEEQTSSARAGDAARTLVNTTLNTSDGRTRSVEASVRLIYTHRFKSHPGRSFSTMVHWRHSNSHDKSATTTDNRFYLLDDADEAYGQLERDHTRSHTIRARATWTEPLGPARNGNFLVGAYELTWRRNNSDRNVWEDGLYEPDLSNSFRNLFLTQNIRLGYQKTTRALNAEAGVTFVPSTSKSTSLLDGAKSIPRRNTFYVAPFARLRWKITKTRSLNFNYRTRSSEPSMSQLQPVADVSDPLRIVQGNPLLSPSFNHYMHLRFQDFDSDAQRSIMAMAFFNVTSNSIVSHTTYNATTGGQYTTYENVNGVWNGRVMCMLSTPFRNRSWSFNNHFFTRLQRSIGFTDALRTSTFTTNISEQPSIAFRPDNLELELKPSYSLQFTHASVATDIPTTVHTYGGSFYASWYAPFGLVLNTDVNYSATSGYSDGYNTRLWLWNASVAWQFLRDRSLTLTLKAHDILNQTKAVSRNVTSFYIEDVDVNQLSRYLMLTLSWSFNSFGKGKEPKTDSEFGPGMGRHMGPPPGMGRGPRR